MNGLLLALTEVGIFIILSSYIRFLFNIYYINTLSFYWLSFTVLTGLWEFFYISCRPYVVFMSNKLRENSQHVWTEKYTFESLIPNIFSKIFYSEYGAYADREYMSVKNNWSILIEGTHCVFCSSFAFLSLLYVKTNKCYLFICLSMAFQLMNSILYMGQYLIQTKNKYSVNYDSDDFPCGFLLCKRPFMWVNLFWTLMPITLIISAILSSRF